MPVTQTRENPIEEFSDFGEELGIAYGLKDSSALTQEIARDLAGVRICGRSAKAFQNSRITANFNRRAFIDYRGTRVGNVRQLAEVAALFRHPKLEHFQAVFLKKRAILAHQVVTSRLPNAVSFDRHLTYRMGQVAQKLEADAIYVIHNHPSGNPRPSNEDLATTKKLAYHLGPRFKGHLVLNNKEFALIKPKHIYFGETKEGKEWALGDVAFLPYLTTKLDFRRGLPRSGSPEDAIAILAKDFKERRDIVVLFLDTNRRVLAIDSIHQGSNLNQFCRQQMIRYGAVDFIVAYERGMSPRIQGPVPLELLDVIVRNKNGSWSTLSRGDKEIGKTFMRRSGQAMGEAIQEGGGYYRVQEGGELFDDEILRALTVPKGRKKALKKEIVSNAPILAWSPPKPTELTLPTSKEESASNLEAQGEPRLSEPALSSRNYRISENDGIGRGTLSEKYQANIQAIKLLKDLEAQGLQATPDQQAVLVKYSGWGGMPQVFDSYNPKFKKKFNEVKALLTEAEYESVRASTPNAHFTSKEVIRAIYAYLEMAGFAGGRVLEPSAGVGNFLGLMPQNIMAASKITAVELDSISGRIAKQLYYDADVRVAGFETLGFPANFFDLAVGNVPFGDYKLHDPELNRFNFSIHDYFFAKATNVVAPGGAVVFITSHFMLDKTNSRLRSYINERADFCGAIRLPNTAFKETASTEVTADIVVLKKRGPGEPPADNPWTQVLEQDFRGKSYYLNEYFVKHPEMMLGKVAMEKAMYGADQFTLRADGRDLGPALQEAFGRLPALSLKPTIVRSEPVSLKPHAGNLESLKPGGLTVVEGKAYQRLGNELIEAAGVSPARVEAMIRVRKAVHTLLANQAKPETGEVQIKRDQAILADAYGLFVKEFGWFSDRANERAFRVDPDYPLLLSLETFDKVTKTFKKADAFFKRVIEPVKRIEKAESSQDALNIALSELGRVDFGRLGSLTGKKDKEIQQELKGLIFNDPGKGWITAEEYLSGEVKKKLVLAQSAAQADPAFKENVEALDAVQPEALTPGEIEVRLGATWLEPKYIEDFINELVEVEDAVTVSYSPLTATWDVEKKRYSRWHLEESVANTSTWGTERIDAVDLAELALNGKAPALKDKIDEKTLVVNREATEAAREKQFQIKQKFSRWVWQGNEEKSVNRIKDLVTTYNDRFNNIRPRSFNGSHLMLPGMNPAIELLPHQKDAIWRMLQSPNTLLAHVVGAGKTYAMIAAGMEMRRIGLRKKPMYVVPNHLAAQWAGAFIELYPDANILITRKEDFESRNRRVLISKIATGDWDGVIVAHSSFGKIPMSEGAIHSFLREQIVEFEDSIRALSEEQGKRARTVKNLEKAKKRLEARLKASLDEERKDQTITFEETGVDQLFVDEAQAFKNLFFVTKMQRIAGLPQTDSLRAFDMFLKIRHIHGVNNGAGIVFASGTPISNTIAEMFTMQRYLDLASMKADGLSMFDAWAANFGDIVTRLELSPDGSSYNVRSAFAKFINLPELMSRFLSFADVRTADMLDLPRPKLKGGKAIEVISPAGKELKAYVQTLVKRAEKVKAGGVDPTIDNMLKVTNDGRKAALDMRLIDPEAGDFPESKVNQLVGNAHQIWQRTAGQRLTQLIFCDLSTPGDGFNVYDDARNKLVSLGIPREEISFIHEYQTDQSKRLLFDRVNAGETRILIGSTEKMGTGMNVQTLLIAEHHLDAPWRPDQVEQRDGRILRRGNQNPEVEIYRYVTRGSFDAYMWQTLERKAKFIDQVMSGRIITRAAEDVEGRALTYEEMKAAASDNPLIIEKIKTDIEVQRLQLLLAAHQKAKFNAQQELGLIPHHIERPRSVIPKYEQDLKTLTIHKGAEFKMVIEGTLYTQRKEAGEAILAKAAEPQLIGRRREFEFGSYNGFSLYLVHSGLAFVQHQIYVKGQGADYYGSIGDSALGTIASLDHSLSLETIEKRIASARQEVASQEKKLEDTKNMIQRPFDHEKTLGELLKKQAALDRRLSLDKSEANTAVLEEKQQEEDTAEQGEEKEPDLREESSPYIKENVPTGQEQMPTDIKPFKRLNRKGGLSL